MNRMLSDREGLTKPDAKVLNDIETLGWHVTKVFRAEGEEGPEWAFSIGLFHSFRHPEIIILGLPLERCAAIINEIGVAIKAGKSYESEVEYADILKDPYRCEFRPVARRHYRDYVGYALWFYEEDTFPLLQCFWPDKSGKFPWHPECNSFVRDSQPLLFLTGERQA